MPTENDLNPIVKKMVAHKWESRKKPPRVKRKKQKKKAVRKETEICGISVPNKLLSTLKAVKLLQNGIWLLTNRNGVVLAEFATENELENWWELFNRFLGRQPPPLQNKAEKPKDSTKKAAEPVSKRKTGRIRVANTVINPADKAGMPAGFSENAVTGHMKPWSEKYDMPEFDYE